MLLKIAIYWGCGLLIFVLGAMWGGRRRQDCEGLHIPFKPRRPRPELPTSWVMPRRLLRVEPVLPIPEPPGLQRSEEVGVRSQKGDGGEGIRTGDTPARGAIDEPTRQAWIEFAKSEAAAAAREKRRAGGERSGIRGGDATARSEEL